MEPDQQSTVVAAERDNEIDNEEKTDTKSETTTKCDDESNKSEKSENVPAIKETNKEEKRKEVIEEQKQEQQKTELSNEKECNDNASRVENNNNSNNDDSTDKKSELVSSQCTDEKSAETNISNDNGNETKETTVEITKADNSAISEEQKSVVDNSEAVKEEVVKSSSPSSSTSQMETTNSKPILPESNNNNNNNDGDGKFEIDSSSLLDRIILHTLKNTVVDNSRLNAAKNKYIMNNGNVNNITSSTNNNNNSNSSNGSDSNPSSKSVERLIEEFKGSCKSNNNNTPNMSVKEQTQQLKSDNIEVTNGADRNYCSVKNDVDLTTTTIKSLDTDKSLSHNSENEALDFREFSSPSSKIDEKVVAAAPAAAMLDLSVKRDEREKTVPPIKRSHALYVGLPDFSKQIFTAPSITRTTNTLTNQGAKQLPIQLSSSITVPKVRNPDFTAMNRAPELQMRHPDFSKGFSKLESSSPSPVNIPVTPSNFPEIVRKNNYISDLQLKPPTNASSQITPSTSYKIDYRPPVIPQQQHQSPYQNSKKEGVYNHQTQQHSNVEEPMAHVIHKNQFLPTNSNAWNEHHRNERLLGGSSHYEMNQVDRKASMPAFQSNEDLRRLHPAHYPYAYKDREAQSNEFSLKQKEQQLRQEGTIITIKNDTSSKTPTREITERRSADLFRDYKLKQPKESPDTLRRNIESQQHQQIPPPPLVYQQQYPDFPPNYPRPHKIEKVNQNSPIPTQSNHIPSEYSQSIPRQYQNPSPIHRQDKSPMNPPQNWPPPPPLVQQQSPIHAVSPATAAAGSSTLPSASPTHYQMGVVSKISPSQSPISSYSNYPQKVLQQQPFKYPEPSSSSRINDVKNSYHHPQSPSPNQNQNYYHQKYPDFGRKFDNNYLSSESHNSTKYPSSFVPIESKSVVHETTQHSLPMRHDLEIRTVREQPSPDNRNLNYRQQQPSSSYYTQERDRNLPRIPMHSHVTQEQSNPSISQEGMSHFSRTHNEAPRVPPDLKIEKRTDETAQRLYSPIPTRRVEVGPELSIIPKVKTEPLSTPISREIPSNSSIIKSTKSLFTEVKRESPLDLSVKTVKTKADSTGCDQDFQTRYRKEQKIGLKVEFTPNFGNVSKTECRQQARLGPQDFSAERAINAVPIRYTKDPEMSRGVPSKMHQTNIASSSSSGRNHYYEQKAPSELERPHAPAPPSSGYYAERSNHKPNNVYENNRNTISPVKQHSVSVPYENHGSFQHNEQHRLHNQSSMPQANNIPYPVINKAPSALESHRIPTHGSINSKDPLFLERERDRKYVEDILYGRNRREQQFAPESRQFHVNPSPPRKRLLEMSQQQQIYDSMSAKQSRIEEPPKIFTNNPPTHINHNQQQPQPYGYSDTREKINTPPVLVRHENYPRAVPVQTKHYPLPRKDVIKSAEMMSYNNNRVAPTTSYYPNPKAEMIHRSDPMNSHKYYSNHHSSSSPQVHRLQNFQQRPDDTKFPAMHARLPHPVQEIGNKIEKQQTPGPLSNNNIIGERQIINGMMSSTMSGSNGNIAQSTIQKLKSNLEFKEMQKLKIQSAESERQSPHGIQTTKSELSPRQFRTKGELKGFIPLPMNASTADSSNKAAIDSQVVATAFDLLDWGSACNDFVQQLQTGKKRIKKKRSLIKSDEKMMARIPGTTVNDLSEIPKEILQSINRKERSSSSDEDKPLLQLKNSISQSSLTESVSEILSRNFREKQRLEVEQKMAARLGRPSSSESETDTRKHMTIIKRVRRLRKRAALGIKKTDDERSAEEEEGDTEKISLKNISKLDNLTSSDEDNKKKQGTNDKKISDEKSFKNIRKSSLSVITEIKKEPNDKDDTSTESTESEDEDESETTEDKLNKLSTAKNVKKLKDLGDRESNIKNLLEEGETMTRSKRRLEIEKKLSNSKILRNEKVVQNVSPDKKVKQQETSGNKKSPLKRKDSCKSEDSKRKVPESESEKDVKGGAKKRHRKSSQIDNNNSSSEETEVEEEESRTERLRPRKNKTDGDTATTKGTKDNNKKIKVEKDEQEASTETVSKTPDYKEGRRSLPAYHPFREDKTSKFLPGWEAETFNFKRTLKVPIDPEISDTSEIFSEFVKSKEKIEGTKDAKAENSTKSATKANKKLQPPPAKIAASSSNSIIDLLHERALQSKKKLKIKKTANINNSVKGTSNNDDDLLPTPQKESEKVFGFKKNIFEPFVITSRTRTENNAIRKKEVLKEVFGADDERPRSAPPSVDEIDDSNKVEKKINFDEKYLEYLEKMNVNFPERKKIKLDAPKTDVSIKEEGDEDFDDNETVVASERDLVTPTLKGKVKKNRPRRCKGSSGFDYIRKKKKPTQNASENPSSVGNLIKKRLAAMENLETKNENDISKEIKGWVLNKGVGESILHKAARLDYVDVIAYCLDRLNMNPDPKDNAGYTPLHEACSRGHLEIARLLLQYGASHSESALSGIRPLHEAIENSHIEIVRLLLSFGADPCLATYSGQLPITMAEDKEMEDFLNEYLIDIGHKDGVKTSWSIDAAYKIEDPDEIGYDIFNNVPIVKTDLGSSVASILSTSMTSLITATTQMSDNETVISETAATTLPNKFSITPMKAPSQDFSKYQHKMKKCDTDTNSNNLLMSDANNAEIAKLNNLTNNSKKTKNCSVLLNNIDSTMKKIKKLPAISKLDSHIKSNEPAHNKLDDIRNQKDDYDDMIIDENLESDCEFLEVEESEAPLPPLYLLRDEGADKWVLLTDLCNLLKVKSKEAVLKQICPSSPPTAANKSELIRELKMSDFLEKAICLQLFCAGEKINVRASKVSLVKYNESVKNLLGVQTIRMNM
ncbi:hypothetical protein PVAND_007322 [Polypedilum vanderplanki]|uniref:Uncharacterized protein n=1 Tax=Polypedilum vanderplanki TaxID=319348 RepID=A0A9J6C6L3_POLVA|nr:hypothetical protein PVAND_007322 [Polypedilum vanderplanki]